ncbi:uncharacterized protein MELLADRAFT_59493 [Melampsora larici-populina 98AG31]|uniref:Uncharacterized protein n=1 Tax=Melampsora larici-populina (strain 98AG31 / pathotype 3-4-7) TaxID=747676 RepID=F4R7P7_MELLP|nr:uncharacterized protein MELLADRAFT_59493 [Melampsora larici-populina 98AG31]EGG11746.1 hypothetical protein MELLADRAFT_59493 [Melampsora larici-populina 98AG31]
MSDLPFDAGLRVKWSGLFELGLEIPIGVTPDRAQQLVRVSVPLLEFDLPNLHFLLVTTAIDGKVLNNQCYYLSGYIGLILAEGNLRMHPTNECFGTPQPSGSPHPRSSKMGVEAQGRIARIWRREGVIENEVAWMLMLTHTASRLTKRGLVAKHSILETSLMLKSLR